MNLDGSSAKAYEVVNLQRVEEKFAKLAKRAVKLGVTAPSYVVTGSHLEYEFVQRESHYWTKITSDKNHEPGVRYTGAVRQVHHVVLQCDVTTLKMAGWTFLATLDHELGQDNTIVRMVPGAEGQLPVDYRHRGNICDHCKRSQARKQTFVVLHDDGRLLQVGSTCIKDFLGHDVVQALGLLELLTLSGAVLEEDEQFRSPVPTVFDLVEYLAWVCKDVREAGWVSRKVAQERGASATADRAMTALLKAR